MVFLVVNAEAFPKGADLSAYQSLCDKFGAYECGKSDAHKYDKMLDDIQSQVGGLEPKPKYEFLAAYVADDLKNLSYFQQSESQDFPVKLCYSEAYKIAWLEPDYSAAESGKVYNESFASAKERCAEFGVKRCSDDLEIIKISEVIGEQASKVAMDELAFAADESVLEYAYGAEQ